MWAPCKEKFISGKGDLSMKKQTKWKMFIGFCLILILCCVLFCELLLFKCREEGQTLIMHAALAKIYWKLRDFEFIAEEKYLFCPCNAQADFLSRRSCAGSASYFIEKNVVTVGMYWCKKLLSFNTTIFEINFFYYKCENHSPSI